MKNVQVFSSRSKVRSVRTLEIGKEMLISLSFHPVQKSGQFAPHGDGNRTKANKVFIPFKSPVSSHHEGISKFTEVLSKFSSRSKVRSVRTKNMQVPDHSLMRFHPVQKSGQFAPLNLLNTNKKK